MLLQSPGGGFFLVKQIRTLSLWEDVQNSRTRNRSRISGTGLGEGVTRDDAPVLNWLGEGDFNTSRHAVLCRERAVLVVLAEVVEFIFLGILLYRGVLRFGSLARSPGSFTRIRIVRSYASELSR